MEPSPTRSRSMSVARGGQTRWPVQEIADRTPHFRRVAYRPAERPQSRPANGRTAPTTSRTTFASKPGRRPRRSGRCARDLKVFRPPGSGPSQRPLWVDSCRPERQLSGKTTTGVFGAKPPPLLPTSQGAATRPERLSADRKHCNHVRRISSWFKHCSLSSARKTRPCFGKRGDKMQNEKCKISAKWPQAGDVSCHRMWLKIRPLRWYRLPGSNGGPPEPQSGALTN
jgi:hypothetical protein